MVKLIQFHFIALKLKIDQPHYADAESNIEPTEGRIRELSEIIDHTHFVSN